MAYLESSGGGATKAQEFDSSGTFTVPAGVSLLWVSAQGGGAGGGGGQQGSIVNLGGTGGKSGWTILRQSILVTPGQTIAVTIGAGGNGGRVGYTPGQGGYGGDTSFGTYLVAWGSSHATHVQNANGGDLILLPDSGVMITPQVGGNAMYWFNGPVIYSRPGSSIYTRAGGAAGSYTDTYGGAAGGGSASFFGNGGKGGDFNNATSGSEYGAAGVRGAGGGGGAGEGVGEPPVNYGGNGGAGGHGYVLVEWVG